MASDLLVIVEKLKERAEKYRADAHESCSVDSIERYMARAVLLMDVAICVQDAVNEVTAKKRSIQCPK